jgi:hypothetical protein
MTGPEFEVAMTPTRRPNDADVREAVTDYEDQARDGPKGT